MKKLQSFIFGTVNDYRSVLPRLIVGLVFLSEGFAKLHKEVNHYPIYPAITTFIKNDCPGQTC